jgi:sRNA-binding protein
MSKSDHRATQTLHALLQKRFPLAFPKHYDDLRPLKIGILADVIKQLPDVDPTALRRALANHTNRDGYLLALIHGRGDRRYDLNGQPAGTVTLEERAEAQKRLDASTKRGQDRAERVRTHKEREEKRRQQREIERKNREAKAARKAEHERVQQEIAARKAALIAQGITPESRSERKRRLAREAAKRAAHGPHAQTVSRDTKLERFRSSSGPVSTQPGPPEPATIKTTPGRPLASPGERPEQPPDQVRTPPTKPMPQVKYKKRRTIPLDSLFGPKDDSKENPS